MALWSLLSLWTGRPRLWGLLVCPPVSSQEVCSLGGTWLPRWSAGLPCRQAGVRAQSRTRGHISVWLDEHSCELLKATGFY